MALRAFFILHTLYDNNIENVLFHFWTKGSKPLGAKVLSFSSVVGDEKGSTGLNVLPFNMLKDSHLGV